MPTSVIEFFVQILPITVETLIVLSNIKQWIFEIFLIHNGINCLARPKVEAFRKEIMQACIVEIEQDNNKNLNPIQIQNEAKPLMDMALKNMWKGAWCCVNGLADETEYFGISIGISLAFITGALLISHEAGKALFFLLDFQCWCIIL